MKKRVIFTDLDGTLLNSKYSFESAKIALDILKEQDIPIVIVSSKTRAEIEEYRNKMGVIAPFISENGGGIFIPWRYFSNYNCKGKGEYAEIVLGVKYKKLIEILKKIDLSVGVRGFNEMNYKELSKETGLSLKEAKLAKKREFDEAFILEHKNKEKKLFSLVKKYGLKITKGGRYYHILGDNDKGKAVKILLKLFKKKYGTISSIGLGDSENDLPMLKIVDRRYKVKGPKDWNKIIVKEFGIYDNFIRSCEELYLSSVRVLKKLQFNNGAILASSPGGRYPYIYPRDHAICILGFIDAGLLKNAKKGLKFIIKSQNKNGSFSQRLDKKGKDLSYKPIQLDNTGLVLYSLAKYVKVSMDRDFLLKNKKRVLKSINYLKKQIHKKNLFYSPNSIHELPPLEKGLEVWVNAVCFAGLNELEKIGVKTGIDLGKIKKSINRYLFNGKYFIKNIRINESSSVVSEIDCSSYSLGDYGVFNDNDEKIKKTVEKIEKELTHPKLGGICRYKKYIGRNNGGWGPWPHFTLMICRHFIRIGDKKKADKYLKWILKVSYKNMLPEHIATKKEFLEWVEEYSQAGIVRKDRKIMIDNIKKHEMYRKKELAYSVLPLAWPHAEFIRTWKLYKDSFL